MDSDGLLRALRESSAESSPVAATLVVVLYEQVRLPCVVGRDVADVRCDDPRAQWVPPCPAFLRCVRAVARANPRVRFVTIRASEADPDLDHIALPTINVYRSERALCCGGRLPTHRRATPIPAPRARAARSFGDLVCSEVRVTDELESESDPVELARWLHRYGARP